MRIYLLSFIVALFLLPVISLSQCGPDSTLITMFITVDPWGEENYWELVPTGNACGDGTLLFGANELVGCVGTATVRSRSNGMGTRPTTFHGGKIQVFPVDGDTSTMPLVPVSATVLKSIP
jgi:hypothetical protein